jgi:hypothetical protein
MSVTKDQLQTEATNIVFGNWPVTIAEVLELRDKVGYDLRTFKPTEYSAFERDLDAIALGRVNIGDRRVIRLFTWLRERIKTRQLGESK